MKTDQRLSDAALEAMRRSAGYSAVAKYRNDIYRLVDELRVARTALREIADGAKVTLDVSHPWVGKTARAALPDDLRR